MKARATCATALPTSWASRGRRGEQPQEGRGQAGLDPARHHRRPKLSEASGATRTNLSRYEKGKGCPKQVQVDSVFDQGAGAAEPDERSATTGRANTPASSVPANRVRPAASYQRVTIPPATRPRPTSTQGRPPTLRAMPLVPAWRTATCGLVDLRGARGGPGGLGPYRRASVADEAAGQARHRGRRSLTERLPKPLEGNAAAYTNYWKTHRYSRHWKAAYEAYLEGRFREHHDAQLGRLRQQRRMTWPAARLRALDLDPRLPARVGPLEPIADRVPD
jgi:hypothetical protein